MANRKKKTAIQLMILHFKRLERVASGIDDEMAYHYRMAIEIAELYLDKEKNIIAKSYREGVQDVCIGSFYGKGIHFYKETYGT